MSRIFITGDTHGDIDYAKLNTRQFKEQKNLTKDDYVIVLGDFGVLWNSYTKYCPDRLSKRDLNFINWYENKNFTTLWIDGNHECIHKDSDILTENGWMNIVDIYNSNKPIKIANLNTQTHQLFYDYPINKIKKYQKTMIEFLGHNVGQCVSNNHDIILNENTKIKAKELLNTIINEKSFNYTVNCVFDNINNITISDELLELIVAIIMDATIVDYKKYNNNSNKARIQFHLKRKDKIQYITNLIEKNKINYTKRFYEKDKSTYINIYSTDARMICNILNSTKTFPQIFNTLTEKQFNIVLKAICNTDGSLRPQNNEIIWHTTDVNNYNIISALCAKFGYNIRTNILLNASGYTIKSKPQYLCSIKKQKQLSTKLSITEIPYNDYSYCFTMPQGNLITRYKHKICLTGNCHTAIKQFPVEEWNGGKIHRISDTLIHLMRGQVYNIDGKVFFTMGGADSIDKLYRVENVSWWKEEMPSYDEYVEAMNNLEKVNFKVDYVLTHCCGTQLLPKLFTMHNNGDELTQFLWHLEKDFGLDFKHWYFGHHHQDKQIDDKHTCLYQNIIEL